MQISVIEKPYEIANSGWDFKLCEILSKADNDNRLALEAFRRAKDGGEKAEILYELREMTIRSTVERLNHLIHEIEDYGPGCASEYIMAP